MSRKSVVINSSLLLTLYFLLNEHRNKKNWQHCAIQIMEDINDKKIEEMIVNSMKQWLATIQLETYVRKME